MRFSVVALVLLSACGAPAEPIVPGPTTARPSATAVVEAPPPVASVPVAAPVLASVDEGALDPSVAPCDDFYAYACGGWMKATPIPDDESDWMRSFDIIAERNELLLRKILEEDGGASAQEKEPYAKQLGDFYASCMDEKGIEAAGDRALKEALAKLDGHEPASIGPILAQLHDGGTSAFFNFTSTQDFKDATQVIGLAEQGGLGLPERDYYLKTDPKSKALRDKYQEHVERMFVLAGESPEMAKEMALGIMRTETRLARASMTKVDLRNPQKIYHRLELAGLKKLAPAFPWDEYLKARGFPSITAINVAEPEFFKAVDASLLSLTGVAGRSEWRVYLKWHLINSSARTLSSRFVDEDFRFRSILNGAAKILPRWKRCVRATDSAMGEALGRPFVKLTLGTEGKERVKAMIAEIESAMKTNLEHLAFMDDPTRARALEKLRMIANKIGFPDSWRNYDALMIDRRSYFENARRANAFEERRLLAKIGKPLDRTEWGMTPPMVNAYYDASLNEMVFPAGILQPPFYANQATNGLNYGAIGMVMGHELTHGFDDEGRQFDGHGNLTDWWTRTAGDEFKKRAACVTSQFDAYVVDEDVHVNGKLTLGENIADLGGIKLAFRALKDTLAHPRPESAAAGKFTPEQQFFLGFAQGWCGNTRKEEARLRAATDAHAPPRYRVIGPLSNTPEFAEAFACKAGSPMVRPAAKRCDVW
jgi:putative endopeptidase